MKHNLVNFTRGSQLLGHFGFMFAAGLKGPLIVTVLVILGLGWWEVRSSLSEQQIHLIWMHLYASAYGFMEFDPGKLVHLKLGSGETVAFPMSVVTQYPPMREAVAAFGEALVPYDGGGSEQFCALAAQTMFAKLASNLPRKDGAPTRRSPTS